MTRFRRIAATTLATLIGVTASLAGPTAANAGSWHSIEGETYSTGGKFYLSSTWRYKVLDNYVFIKFSKLPQYSSSSTVDGVKWRFYFGSDGYSTKYTLDELSTQYRIKYMTDGTAFKNSFARVTTCTDDCSHTFVGTEHY
ncbi:hypothetical protein [Actinoplanes sp. NPDC051851]|uniref:hypothetical protein n=1 Tax=Actinoplanes sp. NPDC051851 TaxID=3154753 RepID=UPI0034447B6A